MNTFRWGILGPGNIAKSFAKGLSAVEGAELLSVASASSVARAERFAKEFGAAKAFGSYDELLADPEVDAVYVSTLNHQHLEATLSSLDACKPTLCEKPIAVSQAQAERMFCKSAEKRTFLMEGMWTRFLPAIRKAREWVAAGRIGEARIIRASFGFRGGPVDKSQRLFNPELAAGSLLDVGIYPLSFAQHFFDAEPLEVKAAAFIGPTGVDEQSALLCEYQGGRLALLDGAVRTNTEHLATIDGTDGRVRIAPKFWRATRAELYDGKGQVVETFEEPFRASGFEYEAEEVMRCVQESLIESPVMPHAQSVSNMQVLDKARAQIGLKYPFE